MKKSTLFVLILSLSVYLCSCSDNPSSQYKKNSKQNNELPDVKIVKVSQLAGDVATIKGKVLTGGGSPLQEAGFCWDTTGTPTVKSSMHKKASQTTVGNIFSVTASNLKSNTSYHVRAYAKNEAGIAYSKMLNVITTNQIKLAQVKIVNLLLISNKKVTIEGKILDGTFSEVGLCWDKSVVVPTFKNSHCVEASYLVHASKTFTTTMSNLANRTTYHVRAYAKNNAGISYSDTLSVTTGTNWEKAANKSINAFNTYFYDSTSTNLYYGSMERSRIAGGWIQAIYLDMVMDAYKRTGNDKYIDLINKICQGAKRRYSNFDWEKIKNVKKWIYDDMLWWVNALVRAYNITHKNEYLKEAKKGFKFVWDEAWDSEHGGGIIWTWKNPGDYGKVSASNWPGAIAAVRLYKITGNSDYLTKAKKVYSWSRKHLFEPSTGRVADNVHLNNHGGIDPPVFNDLPYNQGMCVGAALKLYEITNNKFYLDDAIAAANYTKNKMSNKNGIWNAHDGGHEQGVQQGILAHWVAKLVQKLDGNQKQIYADWLRKNANIVWSNSDPFRHLMGRDFSKPVPFESFIYSYSASSGAELLQVVPTKQ